MNEKDFRTTFEATPAHVVFELDGTRKTYLKERLGIPGVTKSDAKLVLSHLLEPSFNWYFSQSGIEIKKPKPIQKAEEPILTLQFSEIKQVALLISRKKSGMPIVPNFPINHYLGVLKIELKETRPLYFDTLILSDLPKVLAVFAKANIPVKDVYEVLDVLKSSKNFDVVYRHFEKNLDKLAQENGLQPEKQIW